MDLKLKNNTNLILPRYIPVEYIETSGNVAIDTGVSISTSTNYTIETTLEILSNTNKIGRIYGTVYNNSIWYMGLFASASSSTDCVTRSILNAKRTPIINISLDGKTDIVHTNSYIKVNNTTYDFTTGSDSASTYNLRLFYQHNTSYGVVTGKIWKFKVKISDNVVVNYIPCLSTELNHFGEPALYDKVSNSYKYPASAGSFSAPSVINFYDTISSAYIKDCPNIDGIDLLRRALNLSRIRCNINNSTGHIAEIYRYTQLSGFNDAGEQQTKPRIVGTFNVDDYYTDAEVAEVRDKIDGITITLPSQTDYDVEYLLDNDLLAIQTLDPDKPNYNPAAAILLNSKGTITDKWHTLVTPIIPGGGRWFITKSDASTITGIGTIFRGETTVVDTQGIVSSDTTAEYDFETFNELEYFGIIAFSNGSSTTNLGAFGNCTKLREIKIPNSLTNIGIYTFYGCSNLLELHLPANITTVSTSSYGLDACTKLSIFTSKSTINTSFINGTHASNSVCHIYKDLTRGYTVYSGFDKIFIYNDIKATTGTNSLFSSPTITQVRIKRNVSFNSNYLFYTTNTTAECNITFLEVLGTIDNLLYRNPTNLAFAKRCIGTNSIIHLGKNSMHAQSVIIPGTHYDSVISKVCVGDGSSRQNDEDVLALYLADSSWSAYSAKLATWYDYNGEYKWYYVTDNLTNCTNTNPDEWPHITRGEEYRTTIVANEGYTLGTVKVEMYSARDNSPTPDEPTDITSTVYDATTGEIYINSVMGNIIITASAS